MCALISGSLSYVVRPAERRSSPKGQGFPFAVREAVGQLKAIVCLNIFHMDSSAGIPFHQALEKVSGGIDGLLRAGSQKAESGERINGGILEQAQLRIGNAASRDRLPICPDPLSRIGHLPVRPGRIGLFLLFPRKYIITRNSLSGRQVHPRCLRRCRSSARPSCGLRRRISRISFSSASVC